MKKTLLTPLFMLLAAAVFAQNGNLVVFAEAGERFYLILNGLKHNEEPETNIKVEGLAEAPFKAKIVFEDNTLGTVEKTLYVTSGKETTYALKMKGDSKTGKGIKRLGNDLHSTIGSATRYDEKEERYVIRMFSQTDIPITTTPAPEKTNTGTVQNTSTQTTTTTTTTTSEAQPTNNGTSESFSMNVNISEGGNSESVGMNVNVKESGSNNTNMNVNVDESHTYTETTTVTSTTGTQSNTVSNNGRCDFPMDDGDFAEAKGSIKSKTFSDSKMTLAKQITRNNCPTATQVKGFVQLFTYESDKLEYAKFAYEYCYDTGNYYKVNDAFEFESTIEELDEYISGR